MVVYPIDGGSTGQLDERKVQGSNDIRSSNCGYISGSSEGSPTDYLHEWIFLKVEFRCGFLGDHIPRILCQLP